MPPDPSTLPVSTRTLATLCNGISVRRVQQLADAGVLPRLAHGTWDALVCVPAFISHRAAEAEAKAAQTPAGERIRELKAEDLALRLEERSRALITEAQAEALALIDEFAGPLRADLSAIIPRVTKDLALRRRLEDEFGAAFRAASGRAAREAQEHPQADRTKRGRKRA